MKFDKHDSHPRSKRNCVRAFEDCEVFGRLAEVPNPRGARRTDPRVLPSAKVCYIATKPVNVVSVPQRTPFQYAGGKTWLVPLHSRVAAGLKNRFHFFLGRRNRLGENREILRIL